MPSSNPIPKVAEVERVTAISSRDDAEANPVTIMTKPPDAGSPVQSTKLSGAEIKARNKAEKAARRQQEIQAREVGSAAAVPGSGIKVEAYGSAPGGKSGARNGREAGKGHHKRTGSMAADPKNLAVRGVPQAMSGPPEPQPEDKTVELFRHLYKTRATTIAGAGKEVHPAVLALGQQMSSYTICGSNARLVATLQAFKRVSFLITTI